MQLPRGWAAARVGELVEMGPRNKCEDDVEVGFVPLQRLGVRYRSRHTFERRRWAAVKKGYTHFADGDVLLARITPSFENGKAGIARDLPSGIGAGSTEYFVCRPVREVLLAEYLLAHFKTPQFVREGAMVMSGAVGQQRVPKNYVLDSELPLAPLNEQKRIADKLDAVLARVDACRERLERVPDILKCFREAVLAAATSGRLTEDWRSANPQHAEAAAQLTAVVRGYHEAAGGHKAGNAAPPTEGVHDLSADASPAGWELLTLRELVRPDRPITYGILKPGPDREGGVLYVRVADYPGEILNLGTVRRTSVEMDREFKRSRLECDDLLLSIRGSVGRVVVVPDALEGANITQDSARLSICPAVNGDYVLWFLRSRSAQARMRAATKGVAVRGINIGDVRALQVPLPCRDEQDEIVRRVEAIFACANHLEARYAAARAQIERLTPTLLAKAFRGEMVPGDPNDDPASVLLERVRAARTGDSDTRRRLAATKKVRAARPKRVAARP